MTDKPASLRRRPPSRVPARLHVLRGYFRAAGRLAPRAAGRQAYRLWFRTQRFTPPVREQYWRAQAATDAIDGAHGRVAVYSWGSGPTVLLVHGWNGRGLQMGGLAAALAAAGYRAVAPDLPAHGASDGTRTHIFQIMDALQRVVGRYGPPHGIVAHSFGALSSLLAAYNGMPAGRVACISPPPSLNWLAERFQASLRLPAAAARHFERMVEDEFGADIWERVAVDRFASGLALPGLVIHDEDDRQVNWRHGEAVARAWTGARFVKTVGLGHQRILRAPFVAAQVTEFLANN